MYKKYITFFMLFFTFGCSQRIAKADVIYPTKSFVKVYKYFKIEECTKETPCITGTFVSTGSGIAIKNIGEGTLIFTAGHLCTTELNNKTKASVKKYSVWFEVEAHTGEHFKSSVIDNTLDPTDVRDLCAMFSPHVKLKPVKIAKRAPKVGEKVYAMSAIAGAYHAPTVPLFEGRYSGLFPDKINAMTTIPAKGGSSGSGVLNQRGELVGILFAINARANHVSIMSSWNTTMKFYLDVMKKIKKDPTILN